MAIEIGPIAKPQIWLIGNKVIKAATWEAFSERVDHAVHLNPVTTNTISSVSNYDETDVLTFAERVRVIITTKASPQSTYITQRAALGALEFEGSQPFQPDSGENKDLGGTNQNLEKNMYAETYYTINGKDPVRTKAYLYKYLDLNSADYEESDHGILEIMNETELGFTLSANNTGNYLVTLKAKTYQYGRESDLAVARFKVSRVPGSIIVENIENGTP